MFLAKSCSVDLSSGDLLQLELWLCCCRDLQATLLSVLQTPKSIRDCNRNRKNCLRNISKHQSLWDDTCCASPLSNCYVPRDLHSLAQIFLLRAMLSRSMKLGLFQVLYALCSTWTTCAILNELKIKVFIISKQSHKICMLWRTFYLFFWKQTKSIFLFFHYHEVVHWQPVWTQWRICNRNSMLLRVFGWQ